MLFKNQLMLVGVKKRTLLVSVINVIYLGALSIMYIKENNEG